MVVKRVSFFDFGCFYCPGYSFSSLKSRGGYNKIPVDFHRVASLPSASDKKVWKPLNNSCVAPLHPIDACCRLSPFGPISGSVGSLCRFLDCFKLSGIFLKNNLHQLVSFISSACCTNSIFPDFYQFLPIFVKIIFTQNVWKITKNFKN